MLRRIVTFPAVPTLAAALVVGPLWLGDAASGTTSQASVIEAAMPPTIGAGIVAAQANLAPRPRSMMVGGGIPLGPITACGWHWLVGRLAARAASTLSRDPALDPAAFGPAHDRSTCRPGTTDFPTRRHRGNIDT